MRAYSLLIRVRVILDPKPSGEYWGQGMYMSWMECRFIRGHCKHTHSHFHTHTHTFTHRGKFWNDRHDLGRWTETGDSRKETWIEPGTLELMWGGYSPIEIHSTGTKTAPDGITPGSTETARCGAFISERPCTVNLFREWTDGFPCLVLLLINPCPDPRFWKRKYLLSFLFYSLTLVLLIVIQALVATLLVKINR